MPLTAADLDRIAALARAATPEGRIANDVYRCVQTHGPTVPLAAVCYYGNTPLAEADAELIAALTPATVLALVEAARRGITAPEPAFFINGIRADVIAPGTILVNGRPVTPAPDGTYKLGPLPFTITRPEPI